MKVIIVMGEGGRVRVLSEDSSEEKIQRVKDELKHEMGRCGVARGDTWHYKTEVQ